VGSGDPAPLDPDEPRRVAEAAAEMGLKHVVITTVTRDDVSDGGAAHFVAVIAAVRDAVPEASIEVLTSDFGGRLESVDTVVVARPDVFNHNLETVPRLYEMVRPQADYRRSLDVLGRAKKSAALRHMGTPPATGLPSTPTKSGLMLGLGETVDEVREVMHDLLDVGASMLTLGQYLRPSKNHLPVAEFVKPEVFAQLEADARHMGFAAVASAPYVRSSYHAGELASHAGSV
jgi:lipoic acid synthetase